MLSFLIGRYPPRHSLHLEPVISRWASFSSVVDGVWDLRPHVVELPCRDTILFNLFSSLHDSLTFFRFAMGEGIAS